MDHVRGSSLVYPPVIEALRPFIVTAWTGRTTAEMPSDVRAMFDAAEIRAPHVNLALIALDAEGRVLRSYLPFVRPPAFGFDPEMQGRDFKRQLDEMLAGLRWPQVTTLAQRKLTLPDVCAPGVAAPQPAGVRIYLMFSANRLNHYRTPTVEAVALSDATKQTLQYPTQARSLAVAALRPWLEQMYPPAIMDGKGGMRAIEGRLQMTPAGADSEWRYALLEGTVQFTLDNVNVTTYPGNLSVVLKYRRDATELHSVRGVLESLVPKSNPQGQVVERIRMTAAIESLPK